MDGVSRRNFMRSAAVSGAALGAFTILGSTAKGAGKAFKVGVIGCGGRGSGAISQHAKAAEILNKALNLDIKIEVIGTADFAKGSAEGTGKRFGLDPKVCFGGADAYRKLIALKPDTICMATPPVFRPLHIEACVDAGIHVFTEKPVGVDPVGCRRVIAAGEKAKQKGLYICAGTQRRHQKNYREWKARIDEGAYGRIMGGAVSWCMGKIFSNTPINPKTPADLAGRGKWQLWVEMSGDHICEQHVHNIDIANWFLDSPPLSAWAFGHRARRVAGNMYDFFSGDLEYPNNVHIHSMCRQIGGTSTWVGERFTYEKEPPKDYQLKKPAIIEEIPQVRGGHQQEHVNLLYRMVKGLPLNEAKNVAEATAAAVMVRDSAYTGKKITWEEMMVNPKKNPDYYNQQLSPTAEDFETGSVRMLKDGAIRIPGK
jgi:predicted dehydrogenase